MPDQPASPATARNPSLYQTILKEAAAGGSVLMGRLVAAGRTALQAQEAASRDLRERDALVESANLLRRHEPQLCKAYPEALLLAFSRPHAPVQTAVPSAAEVQFDQLELMDDAQVQATVTLARVQQVAMLVVEAGLAELNTLMSSVLGLHSVRADVNPLRPEVYVNALKDVIGHTQAAPAVQAQWFNAMSAALGQELRTMYGELCARLRKEGVVSVTYSMPSGAGAPGGAAAASPAGSAGAQAGVGLGAGDRGATLGQAPLAAQDYGRQPRSAAQALLTLDRLHRLLSGASVPQPAGSSVEQFAAQFSQQFEREAGVPQEPASDYANTLPAALEALNEMQQVERVAQTLEQRRAGAAPSAPPDSVEAQRQLLRARARTTAQALSLEVVALMVENMAQDVRLLEPVGALIRRLEPALLRLALVDQRFFSDKQHPARRLLHELTHRSMAFESVAARGFDDFMQGLQAALEPLQHSTVENAEVFEQQLHSLEQAWSDSARATERDRDMAVEVLQHAEARNLLAEKVARDIELRADAAEVPAVVLDFLCGPWAQVLAQARIQHGAGSAADEKFEALVPSLLWSAHPTLARANPAKLTRVVPRLLTTLREGLDSIHYPATATSAFLEALMAIHQMVLHAAHGKPVPEAPASEPPTTTGGRLRPVADGSPWIAPEEALVSHFMESQDGADAPATAAPLMPDAWTGPEATAAAIQALPLGSWVELWVHGKWTRTQLTWASPHGTLYLFTGAYGTTQSISRRMCDRMLASGKLRLVSGRPLDQGALDAVAQAAMRNSVYGAA